jgi:hypothetical protein
MNPSKCPSKDEDRDLEHRCAFHDASRPKQSHRPKINSVAGPHHKSELGLIVHIKRFEPVANWDPAATRFGRCGEAARLDFGF